MSGPCISTRLTALMFLWKWLTLSLLQSWVTLGAGAADHAGAGFGGSGGRLGWLLSDKGPFHHSQEFVDFTERYQQGFTTKYKIYSFGEPRHTVRTPDQQNTPEGNDKTIEVFSLEIVLGQFPIILTYICPSDIGGVNFR
ncbi:BMP/retinoic acid-inducible neural-specific protein 3 [Dissostichus eleginoides]|uniref:BMP/retinoic acid-inducible neural-specific protein 3 n=1 Tax=Dissostichus eleginoides TaxID=100907 RepID=A0AAD9C817_DISEL|nr:BMP/retinoic acid-inducible neural-specific protein 3 [Dissostichus eleginoides]